VGLLRWTAVLGCGLCVGCGTTKWTDTARTATEQLLISDSMDRAVSRIDFRALAGKKVFVDDAPIKGMTDANYLISTLRQQILASGGVLKDAKDQAEYILEVRAGALGTDRHDVLFGIPATNIPTIVTAPGIPTQIPEIPFVKKTDQRAVTKVAMFLYNRQTGRPVWQSGAMPEESRAKAVWVLGAGPFQRGTIYRGTKFAGDRLNIPLIDPANEMDGGTRVAVNDAAFFVEPKEEPRRDAKPASVAKDGAASSNEQARTAVSGSAPSGGSPPAVVPAAHTTPATAASAGVSQAGAPPAGAPAQPAPPTSINGTGNAPSQRQDRAGQDQMGPELIRPLPPISFFDDPPAPVWSGN
jgi:hypothetical protein